MSERLIYFNSKIERERPINAEFSGFPKGQEKAYRDYLESTLLPTDNIQKVIKIKAGDDMKGVLGFWDPETRTLGITDNADKVPAIARYETAPHEVGHSLTPFNPENEKFYRSKENLEYAQQHTIAVAKQSLETNRYLNPYQAHLARQLKNGEIDEFRFIEETSGIMIGLRYTNPKHLEQVDAAQKAQLKKINPEAKAVDIITTREQQEAGKISGVDVTISNLIPQFKTKEDIDRHIYSLKRKFKDGKKLNDSLKLAA